MMKQMFAWLLVFFGTALTCPAAGAQRQPARPAVTGRIVDEMQQPVAYATVVLLHDGRQAAGQTTDAEGGFALKAAPGRYTLSVEYLGCERLDRSVDLAGDLALGDLVLHAASQQIEGVVVTGQLIRREADRFVVDVANAPAAIGKEGLELLAFAPGIWIDNEKITINGKSGSVVYVNDRRLRLENDQMLAYLRSLRAEDIQKIEVVPLLGADHEADAAGGAIYITLKKQRDNGLTGSLSFATELGGFDRYYSPGGRLNAHSGIFDYSLSLSGSSYRRRFVSDEKTDYTGSDAELASHSEQQSSNPSLYGSAGIICEIVPAHTLGLEFSCQRWSDNGDNDTGSRLLASGRQTHAESRYEECQTNQNYTVNFNYIWKLDTLGSTLKVLADYTRRTNRSDNDRRSRITADDRARDSLYRDRSDNRYAIVSASLAFEKHLSSRWTLKAGAKYTYDRMENAALYEYEQAGSWLTNRAQSYEIDYTEQIAALYGIASAKLGRWNLTAGLRGEYTRTAGKQGVGQDYGSLFPNATLSYALTPNEAYSLIGQYARNIRRPGFWDLTPQRSVISDYLYQIGNPALRPTYREQVSLTLVLKYKYTFTAGATITRDEIEQIVYPDAEQADVLCLTNINWNRHVSYYATATLPLQLTQWWQTNLNLFYQYHALRETERDAMRYQSMCSGSVAMTFTLPRKCYIDVSYRLQSRIDLGQLWVEPMHFVNAGIKKQFGERWTLALRVNNLVQRRQHAGTRGEGFERRMSIQQPWTARSWRISVSYKFNSGKAFGQKRVERETGESERL